ncbi:MAG: DMT family transporter [Bacteroidales bacterium]|nr:DMT family transporter [Bacteroidales bacterium]
MNISPAAKGYFFAFVSVIATSNVYIFSKAALGYVDLAVFGLYWFAFGLLWNSIYSAKTGKLKRLSTFTRNNYLILGLIGLLEIVSTSFFFLAIRTVPNPAIVSFLGNINPLIVTVLGFFILKERYNKPEVFGMLLIVFGAFIISFKGGTTINSMFIEGAEYVLYAGLFSSISAIISKKNVQKLGPSIMALSRNIFLFIFSFSVVLIVGYNWTIGWFPLWNIFIGSILGPFLTVIAGYQAIKYIEVGRKSILGSTKGIFVLIGAYVYFGKFPEIYQVIGGLISILGVILIAVGKLLMKKKKV